MNIWKEIQELELSKERVKESQNRILDMFDKNNQSHISLLQQTVDLHEQYEQLLLKYNNFAKENY